MAVSWWQGQNVQLFKLNADLSATWYPGKQNSLLFQGKDGELFKNYLLRLLNSINGSVINANANNVHDCSTNSLVLPTPDEVNLSPVKVCELTQDNNVGKKLTDYPDNSISDSRPNNKYPDINECSIVCDCLCTESLENIKLDLEILRSQVDSLQSLANSQEACPPVINDFVRLQIELCDERIRNLGTELCLLTKKSTSAIDKLTNKIDCIEAKFENVLNKTIMENSLEDNVSHISFVSQNNVGHDKQKLCVYEQNEINYQGSQRSMPSPTLTIYDNELPKWNNIVGSTMKINQPRQQCIMPETKASFIETPNSAIIIKDQQQSKLQVALSSKKVKEKANLTEWLARLPLIDDDNSIKSPAFKNDTIDKNKSDMCKMTSTKQPSLDTLPPTRPSPQVSKWLARLPLIDHDNSTKSRAFKNNTTDKNKSDMRKRTSTQQPFYIIVHKVPSPANVLFRSVGESGVHRTLE
jgi:hypothetical protein